MQRPQTTLKNVVVLYDRVPEGASADQRDALVQAGAVSAVLRDLGYHPLEVPLSMDLDAFVMRMKALRPAFVFNLVESVEGSGRLIHFAPAVLDYLGISYTGSKTDAIYATSNKKMTKKMLSGAGIATPESFAFEAIRKGGPPSDGLYIIKSTWEHASVGIEEESVVSAEDLLPAMNLRRENLGGDCFAERFIDGREFNLSLLAASERGAEALPPAEIRFEGYSPERRKVVGYRAKWAEDSFEYHHTPRTFEFPARDESLLQRLNDVALRCWEIFDLRGYARVDFRVDKENRSWVLEINANPCLSPDAGFAAAAKHGGLTLTQVVERIIEDIYRS
jgi:D-alanine-D-alanine ligase